ncbi:alveolar macrophage chemotactic factor-like [Aquarana catesbeiana]|uniref:alveolar macrophage chemotactic factor-like n=1 Tax=Aquarana catesbeiana TaxID=8400 RepID=UPI003CC9A616
MRSIRLLLCILLLFHNFSIIYGMPWESNQFRGRCTCLKETSKFIHPKMFKILRIIKERHYCQKMEIVIILKGNQIVCLDAKAAWVQFVILGKRNDKGKPSRKI